MKSLKDILRESEGQITYDELSNLDFSKGMDFLLPSLKEDLLQIQYPENIKLDIGWFPSFDVNGSFKIVVIQDSNWENPLWIKETNDPETLIQKLAAAVTFSKLFAEQNQY